MLAPGGQVGRNYTLIERLGAGELGEVWRARHEKIGRECAIKFIAPPWPLEPKAVAAFLHDARASGQLAQPSLVELLDQGEHDGAPYVVMPLLVSEKLERILLRRGPLAPGLAVRVAEALAHGLAAAHEERVFHRRVEAANVLLHRDPKGKVIPKLVDFGIARLGAGPHQLISPLAYLPPEQLGGDEGDGRADVWALATLLAHCVLGRLPYNAEHAEELADELESRTTLAVEELRALDPQIAAVVREGWTRDRSKRPLMRVYARKLHDLALSRPGSLDALGALLEVPESLSPALLHTIAPAIPPMPRPPKPRSRPSGPPKRKKK